MSQLHASSLLFSIFSRLVLLALLSSIPSYSLFPPLSCPIVVVSMCVFFFVILLATGEKSLPRKINTILNVQHSRRRWRLPSPSSSSLVLIFILLFFFWTLRRSTTTRTTTGDNVKI